MPQPILSRYHRIKNLVEEALVEGLLRYTIKENMGCFSFLCKECNKGILSTSFQGEQVKLYLLKDSKVIEMMEGEYDSYGRVFTDDRKDSIHWKANYPDMSAREMISEEFMESIKDRPEEEKETIMKSIENAQEKQRSDPWGRVCDLMFSHNKGNGIAAVHVRCCTGHIPTTRSENDPNQGWGEEMELMGDVGLNDLIDEKDACLKE